MKTESVGTRGTLFSFPGPPFPTYVYLIHSTNYVFLCDTHLGPESMELVKRHIDENIGPKPIIVFNSHCHYDHVWGNCSFSEELIISHELCRETLIKEAHLSLNNEAHASYKKGAVTIVLPKLTFSRRICFEDEQVEFFHSPGHTPDSSSCHDMKDRVLFAGDNLDQPFPALTWLRLDSYLETLRFYEGLPVDTIIAAHNGLLDKRSLPSLISYVEKYREIPFDVLAANGKGSEDRSIQDARAYVKSFCDQRGIPEEFVNWIHDINLKGILTSNYEALAKKRHGSNFPTTEFASVSWAVLESVKFEELKQNLRRFVE